MNNTIDNMPLAQKIGIFLRIVGEDYSEKIFKHLDETAIVEITKYMILPFNLDKKEINKLLEEIYTIIQSNNLLLSNGESYAKDLLFKSLDYNKAKEIWDKIQKDKSQFEYFSYLKKVDSKTLSHVLEDELPQTIALILSYCDYELAAKVLDNLNADLKADVAIKIAHLEELNPQIVKKLSIVLENKLSSFMDKKIEIGGVKHTAEMLNKSNFSKEILNYIENIDSDLAEQISNKMFTFEDIFSLNKEQILLILKDIKQETLVLSLKGLQEEQKKVFFQCFSEKKCQLLIEEMNFLGQVKKNDVLTARNEILNTVKQLIDNNMIDLKDKDEEYIT